MRREQGSGSIEGGPPQGAPPLGPGRADGPPAGLDGPPPVRPRPARSGIAAVTALVFSAGAGVVLQSALLGTGVAQVDGRALQESVELRSAELTLLATAVTHAGSTAAMAVLAVVAAVWLWVGGRRGHAVLVVGAMAGAAVLFRSMKAVLDRARPPEAGRLVEVGSESLPSGHATMSVVVVGVLVALAWRRYPGSGRVVLALGAAGWVGSVGLSRVYLGVHWFSDVVAGWLVGAAWLAACLAVWWWARRPGSRHLGGPLRLHD
ncbi:MAG TPA: phosphatase PAP2 family protein [Pseudonocardia sp.]|nr:phosphatase PAP2 family protein [Pseudonocardia sp.]